MVTILIMIFFTSSKLNKKSPIEIASLLKDHFLKYFPEIKNIDVAKPGFLNISLYKTFVGNSNWFKSMNSKQKRKIRRSF